MLVDLGKEAVKQGRMSTDTFDTYKSATIGPPDLKKRVREELEGMRAV